MATITDRSRMLDEPIPFVAPETVRRAALFAVERFGSDSADVLDMLGITPATIAHGMGAIAEGVAEARPDPLRDGLGYVPEVVA